jgi:hypothetical protein
MIGSIIVSIVPRLIAVVSCGRTADFASSPPALTVNVPFPCVEVVIADWRVAAHFFFASSRAPGPPKVLEAMHMPSA